MHYHIADHYIQAESPLHRLDARVKVAAAVLLILLISLTPFGALPAFPLLWAIVLAGVILSRMPLWTVLKRSFVALPFAAAAITLVFTVPGRTIGTVPLFGWTLSDAGLVRFVSIVLKSWTSVQVAVLLAMTTHFTDLLWALGALKVPGVLVSIISFMYRYIFVLADEALRLTRAREARSADPEGRGGGTVVWRARVTGGMIGNLFLRSYERSERVYQAMVARGYRGEVRQLTPPPLDTSQLVLGALPVVAALAVEALALLLWS
jgi:cobalt/nickel transport system permease protein